VADEQLQKLQACLHGLVNPPTSPSTTAEAVRPDWFQIPGADRLCFVPEAAQADHGHYVANHEEIGGVLEYLDERQYQLCQAREDGDQIPHPNVERLTNIRQRTRNYTMTEEDLEDQSDLNNGNETDNEQWDDWLSRNELQDANGARRHPKWLLNNVEGQPTPKLYGEAARVLPERPTGSSMATAAKQQRSFRPSHLLPVWLPSSNSTIRSVAVYHQFAAAQHHRPAAVLFGRTASVVEIGTACHSGDLLVTNLRDPVTTQTQLSYRRRWASRLCHGCFRVTPKEDTLQHATLRAVLDARWTTSKYHPTRCFSPSTSDAPRPWLTRRKITRTFDFDTPLETLPWEPCCLHVGRPRNYSGRQVNRSTAAQ
jgi:hypothetical protein